MVKWDYFDIVVGLKSNFENKITTQTCNIRRGYDIFPRKFHLYLNFIILLLDVVLKWVFPSVILLHINSELFTVTLSIVTNW